MKKQILFCIAATFLIAACNNNSNQSSASDNENVSQKSESHDSPDETKIETISVTYKDLNAHTSQFVKSIISDYMGIKSALVKGNERSAAKSAVAMNDHLKSFDKSYFTASQKKEFDSVETNLLSLSADIATQSLKDQRKNFKVLSDNMYQLAKNFQTGQTLYKEYCPMFEGGSAWLSTEKEIQNPYYGDKMMDCGTVQAIIQ